MCETPRSAIPWGCSTCTLLNPAAEKRCKACGEKKRRWKKNKDHKKGKDKDDEKSKRWRYAQDMENEEKGNSDLTDLVYEDRKMPAPAPPSPPSPPISTSSSPSFSVSTTSQPLRISTSKIMREAAAWRKEEDDDDNEDDNHLRAREAFALSLFNEFVTSDEVWGAGLTSSSSSNSSASGDVKGGNPRLTCLCCGKMHSTRRIMVSVKEGERRRGGGTEGRRDGERNAEECYVGN